jgi:hypothetical protein
VTPAVGSKLQRFYRGLEALYETRTGLDPGDVLMPYHRTRHSTPRELLLLRETDDGALEVGLAIDHAVLRKLEAASIDDALSDEGLGDTLPVLEGLSHLVYIAEAARCDRPVSGLELETQAEVDKLAICLLHRWPRAREEFGRLVDRLFYRFELAPLQPDLHERYRTANRIAVGFARRLQPHVESRHLGGFHRTLRHFWRAPMSTKRALGT